MQQHYIGARIQAITEKLIQRAQRKQSASLSSQTLQQAPVSVRRRKGLQNPSDVSLARDLMPYQEEGKHSYWQMCLKLMCFVPGVNFMLACEKNPELRASFCADDMGLGKTMQALAVTLRNPVGCTLIVVPSALIAQNWVAEIELHIHGTPLVFSFPTIDHLRKAPHSIEEMHASADYVIITYSCISSKNKKGSSDNWAKVCHNNIAHCLTLTLLDSFIGMATNHFR